MSRTADTLRPAPAIHGVRSSNLALWSITDRLGAVVNPAWLTVLASLALAALGIYAVDVAETLARGQGQGVSTIVLRQGVYVAVGLAAAVVIVLPHYRWLGYVSGVFFLASICTLVFLLIPFVPSWIVKPHNGARGWINLGVADVQPAEFAKIAYVLVLARYLRFRKDHREFWGLVPPALITMIPVGLIMLQPDLGTAMLFIPALFAMLVAAGARLRHLTIIVLLAALAAPLSFPILKPHQQQRIVGLLKQFRGDASADQDINFQSQTAQVLVGAGGVAGVSDAKARALVHYNALPERHNDMIFAVIVGRFGLFGALAVLGLYALWVVGALAAAAVTHEPFGRLVIVGLAAFVTAQVMVNIGMNIGLMPIVGVTLPLLSYGGSSMLSVWMMTGLILSIALRRPPISITKSLEFGDDA